MEIYDLTLLHSTDKAYLVRTVDDEEIWIPKSLVEYIDLGDSFDDDEGRRCCEINVLEIPEWLADDKGLN